MPGAALQYLSIDHSVRMLPIDHSVRMFAGFTCCVLHPVHACHFLALPFKCTPLILGCAKAETGQAIMVVVIICCACLQPAFRASISGSRRHVEANDADEVEAGQEQVRIPQ